MWDLTATHVLATIGAVTGSIAIYVHVRTYLRDKPILSVNARLKRWHTIEYPELHNNLLVVLKNRGRRIIRIQKVNLLFPGAKEIEINNNKYKLDSLRFHLFKAEDSGFLNIHENDRKEIELEPCDHLPINSNIEAWIEVIDALDKRYLVEVKYINSPPKMEKPKEVMS